MSKVELMAAGQIRVEGDLLFSTVVPIREQLVRLLRDQAGEVKVDFSAVGRVDSSALSLWLCCERQAKQQGLKLDAQAVPEDLMSIARLVGFETDLH